MELITPLRGMADEPISYSRDDYDNPVADVLDGHLATLNADTEIAADLQDELQTVIEEAVEEVGKVTAAQKRYDDAVIAEQDAEGAAAQRAARKELQAAKDALDAAKVEYERREAELLAKLADILERAGLLGGGEGGDGDPTKNTRWRDQQEGDPEPKASPEKPESPSNTPRSTEPPGDSEPKIYPTNPATDLSTSATPTQQQQAYPVAQVQPQQQMPTSSPSAAMPSITPSNFRSPSPSRGKDKSKPSERNLDGVYPVASPVPTQVPIDRGSSVNGGITNRDVSGKPSTSLSTSGQIPGSANANTPRGGGGFMGGAPMGGAGQPLGAGSKSTTASKIIDRDATLTRRGDDDMSTSGGSLSRDSLEKLDKAESDEEDRIAKAIREQRSKGKSTG